MTPQERIKADAEVYALPMVWVNQNPKGEEQLFYEYISSTSYIAGATAENSRAQEELKLAQDAAKMFCNKHNETATQLAELVDRAQVLVDALEAIAGITMPVPNKADMIEIAKKHLEQWKGKESEQPEPQPDLGTCVECGIRKAVADYNGHQYHVCDPCNNRLNREFDKEYI